MQRFTEFCVKLAIVVFYWLMLIDGAEAGWWQDRNKKKIRRQPKRRPSREAIENRERYIRRYDVNGDGRVDTKDRLIWLKNKENLRGEVYISEENEDFLSLMDINADGDVDAEEMKLFYDKYDLDGNGVLDDKEIEKAAEE